MKHNVKIKLPVVPYDHNLRDIIAYIQTVVTELTGTSPEVFVNDYDFTSAADTFKQERRKSHPKRIL